MIGNEASTRAEFDAGNIIKKPFSSLYLLIQFEELVGEKLLEGLGAWRGYEKAIIIRHAIKMKKSREAASLCHAWR
jgi:hypothetical protein